VPSAGEKVIVLYYYYRLYVKQSVFSRFHTLTPVAMLFKITKSFSFIRFIRETDTSHTHKKLTKISKINKQMNRIQ